MTGDDECTPCSHCGLPVRVRRASPDAAASTAASVAAAPQYCCIGCRLAAQITGPSDGPLRLIEARLLASAFLSMGVMEFSLILYGEPVWVPHGDASMDVMRRLGQIGVAVFAFPVLVLLGVPLLGGAWSDLRERRIRMDGLIVLATFSAYSLSLWSTIRGRGPVYYETATMVLTLVTFGRRLEAHARRRGRDAATTLAELLPPAAHRVGAGGGDVAVSPDALVPGDQVRVLPGEAVPADVRITAGAGTVSTEHTTGESVPVAVGVDSVVPAGALNGPAPLAGVVIRPWREGALGRIRALLDAPLPATRTTRLVDGIATKLAWTALALAVAGGAHSWIAAGAADGPGAALRTALSVLLVACPCALGLATPLAYRAMRTALARAGILVNDPTAFEVATHVDTVVFDKTGTLTTTAGDLAFAAGCPAAMQERARALVAHSGHALAGALTRAGAAPTDLHTLVGAGVEASIGGTRCRAGSPKWMDTAGLRWDDAAATARTAAEAAGETIVAYAEDDAVRSIATVAQSVRTGAPAAIDALRRFGLDVVVLSGDHAAPTAAVARGLHVTAVGGLTPAGKVAWITAARAAGHCVLMAGDGVNDAPAIRAADVGIAMASGTAAARAEAQVEIMAGDLRTLPLFLSAARALRSTVRGNLAWTFLYNGIALALATAGRLHPLVAAAAMVISSVVVSVRSYRLLDFRGATT